MAVQFILGSAGSGKSHRLYEMMTKRACENLEREYVALVPEQYSMESQKEIVSLHPKHGGFNTEVVSFNRLALSVLEEMGHDNLAVMDDLGKSLIVCKVMGDCKKELKIYAGKVTMPGFIEKIKTTISELKQYDIDVEALNSMIQASEKKPGLQHKLADLEVVYRHFNEYIANRNITQEDILNIVCQYIQNSDKVKNSEYFIDGFTGFTPVQMNVVEQLIRHAKNVTFAFTIPEEEADFVNYKEQELFALCKRTVLSIKSICNASGVEILPNELVERVTVDGDKRAYRLRGSKELSFLEKNIFRYADSKIYQDECKDITVCKLDSYRDEAVFVATRIAEMMRKDKELRYRDFAVITANMENYYRYLEEAFNAYNMPTFIDNKRSISSNPYVDAIVAIIDILEKDFSYESVFHFMRLGVVDMDDDNIDRMENYVFSSGRRGIKSYSKPWARVYKGMDEEELALINDTKDKLLELVMPLKTVFGDRKLTVKDKVTALYEFTLQINMQKQLEKLATEFEELNNLSLASEYRNTYTTIIMVFDKIVEMLGEEKMSVKDFKNIMQTGFESVKVGIVPPSADSVMVGDIERTRLKDVKKVVFFVGVNDDSIPRKNVGNGIVSDVEREFLSENKYILAPTSRENAFIQKLYLYTILSKPANKLFVTYAKMNTKGEAISKSYLIGVICSMFAKLKVTDVSWKEQHPSQIVFNEKDALKFLSDRLPGYIKNGNDTDFEEIYTIMMQSEDSRDILLKMIDGAFYGRTFEKISKELAADLYGIKDNIGITRIEQFAKCAYSQFLKSGLALKERKHFELVSWDLGNLYHDAIERFSKQINIRKLDWASIDPKIREELVDKCVSEAIDKYDNELLSSTARNIYLTDRVKGVTDKAIKTLGKHLAAGDFKFHKCEVVVEHGRVDRIDVMEDGNDLYVKVIDYKSSAKELSLHDVFHGIKLQILVYLKDSVEYEKREHPDKNVYPAGAFFYPVGDPLVDKPDFETRIPYLKSLPEYRSMTDEELAILVAEEAQYALFKMNGIVSKKDSVIRGIDRDSFDSKSDSTVIPIGYKKDGDIKATHKIAKTQEQLETVIDYAVLKADELSEEILSGKIDVNPVENACRWCPYDSICKFDKSLGDKYREIENNNDIETLELMNLAIRK